MRYADNWINARRAEVSNLNFVMSLKCIGFLVFEASDKMNVHVSSIFKVTKTL